MSEARTEGDFSDQLFEVIRERYGHRLGPEELEEVRKGVEQIAQAAQALKSVKLDNSEEPLSLFLPYRAKEE